MSSALPRSSTENNGFQHWTARSIQLQSSRVRLQCAIRAALPLHHTIRNIHCRIIMASCLTTSEAYVGEGTHLPIYQIGMCFHRRYISVCIADSVVTGCYRSLPGS
jgi:hypothetical protein